MSKEEQAEKHHWYTRLLDAGDGSGDCIFVLPDDLRDQLGWQEGDTVIVSTDKEGDIWIRKKLSQDQPTPPV